METQRERGVQCSTMVGPTHFNLSTSIERAEEQAASIPSTERTGAHTLRNTRRNASSVPRQDTRPLPLARRMCWTATRRQRCPLLSLRGQPESLETHGRRLTLAMLQDSNACGRPASRTGRAKGDSVRLRRRCLYVRASFGPTMILRLPVVYPGPDFSRPLIRKLLIISHCFPHIRRRVVYLKPRIQVCARNVTVCCKPLKSLPGDSYVRPRWRSISR